MFILVPVTSLNPRETLTSWNCLAHREVLAVVAAGVFPVAAASWSISRPGLPVMSSSDLEFRSDFSLVSLRR